jgi:hypothetical protein
MLKYQLSTPMEERIGEKICLGDFNEKFINISQMLIARIARRSERIRENKMIKTDFINGFKRENYPHITQFEIS